MQENQTLNRAEASVDMAEVEWMLSDNSVTEEAKDMLRAAIKANDWQMVGRLLTSEARLPES
jgi:hypothetical protein